MFLENIFEDAAHDFGNSKFAYRFYNELVKYLFQMEKNGYDVSALRRYVVSRGDPDGYPGILSDEMGFSSGMLRGVLVCFRHDDYPEMNGSASPTEQGGNIRFVVQMDAKTNTMKDLAYSVGSNRGKMIILHEIAHVMDYIRFKDKRGIHSRKIVQVKKDMENIGHVPNDELQRRHEEYRKVYHNDPLERNAFFHNIAEPILERMRFLQAGNGGHDFFDPISRDFQTYFKDVLTRNHGVLKQHWETLEPLAKRRNISRLYALFNEYWQMLDRDNSAI